MVKKEEKEHKKESEKEQKKEPNDDKKESKKEEVKLPPELQEKLKAIKDKLEKFQKTVLDKFDKYIVGIALLPPQKAKEGEKAYTEKINALVLVDDSDSQKMSKQELKDKLGAIIEQIAKEIDPNLIPQTVILSELWQSCYD